MFLKVYSMLQKKTKLFAVMISTCGLIGTLNMLCARVLCEGTTLWDTSANDGIVEIAIAFYQHWWWVAVIAEAGLRAWFTWTNDEKKAEYSKKAIFITIGLFIGSYAVGPIRASIVEIASKFTG